MSDADEFTDILTDRDRILMAAWMLPNDGDLSDAQRRQAMENFTAYVRRHGLTLDDVAQKVGSPRTTTIIDLIKRVYRKNADQHIRKLNLWVEQHARANAASLTDTFVTTRVAKAMMTVARLVRENKTMGLALGPTGIGKSRCAQAIHETYVGSIYIRIINGSHHGKGLTAALAEALGVRTSASSRDQKHDTQLERVINTLRDSDRLIIIDEAQKLNDGALETLRDVHDCCGVPVLLIATKDLQDRIMDKIGPDHGQTWSRFDIVHHLSQGKDVYSGGKPLFTIDEIKQLYEVKPIRLAPDAAKYLQAIANQVGHGSLRSCKILLRNAVRRARKRQGLGESDQVKVTASDLQWVEGRLRQESAAQDVVTERRKRAAGACAT